MDKIRNYLELIDSYISKIRCQRNEEYDRSTMSASLNHEISFKLTKTEDQIDIITTCKIFFTPDKGPFEFELENITEFQITDNKAIEDYSDDDIFNVVSILIMSEVSMVVSFISKSMGFLPLILPPQIAHKKEFTVGSEGE